MANEKRKQYVLSQPGKVLVESYLTPKGRKELAKLAQQAHEDTSITPGLYKQMEKAIRAKYMKNRYAVNPEAKVIKMITHDVVGTPFTDVPVEAAPKGATPEAPKKKKGLLKTLSSLAGMLLASIFFFIKR